MLHHYVITLHHNHQQVGENDYHSDEVVRHIALIVDLVDDHHSDEAVLHHQAAVEVDDSLADDEVVEVDEEVGNLLMLLNFLKRKFKSMC